MYIFLRISRICAMRYGRNQHRSDINIHYIPNDPRSTSNPASSFARFPPSARTPLRLLPSVFEATAYRFVIYGESLASRLSDEARYRDSWRLVLRSSTSCTAASATSTLQPRTDLPDFRYLSFRHSLGLIRIAILAGRTVARDYHSEIMISRKGKSSMPFRSTRTERPACS